MNVPIDRMSAFAAIAIAGAIVANLAFGWVVSGAGGRPIDVAGCILAGAVGLSFAFRHAAPGVGLGLAMVASGIYALAGYPGHVGQLMVFVALYYFARATADHTMTIVVTTVISAAIVLGTVMRVEEETFRRLGFIALLALPVVPVLVARTLRANQAQREELERRLAATRAAQTAEAERLLSEQRLAIARDLHDTVAHNVATVSVQSGAALAVFDDDPEAARRALLAIRQSSKAVIAETKSTMATLREAPFGAAPSIETTAAAARKSGLNVMVSDELGRAVPAPTSHAVNRIVQESVANVLRHSTADKVDINLRETNAGLTLLVADNGASVDPASSPGNGLQGMAERAALLRGEFAAGPGVGGGFRVRVDLPLTEPAQ